MSFGVCVIAVLGLHLFGLVASAARPGKCAYHEFWIPGPPGAMVHDRACFLKIRRCCFFKWVWVCVCVCVFNIVFVGKMVLVVV